MALVSHLLQTHPKLAKNGNPVKAPPGLALVTELAVSAIYGSLAQSITAQYIFQHFKETVCFLQRNGNEITSTVQVD